VDFKTDVERIQNDQVLVRVSGELDLSTTEEFEEIFKAVLNTHPRLLIADLSNLTFINSHGMYVLLKAQFRLSQENGEVVILGARPEIMVTLDLVGIPSRIRCVGSLAEAQTPPGKNHSCGSQV